MMATLSKCPRCKRKGVVTAKVRLAKKIGWKTLQTTKRCRYCGWYQSK